MSAATHLYVPKARQPNARPILTPAEYHNQQAARIKESKRVEFKGRNVGKPHGTFVTDEAERKIGILLCSGCSHKFDPKKYQYYLTREFRIQGRCDGCKEHTQGASFFIHEGLLGRKHGQCWWPK